MLTHLVFGAAVAGCLRGVLTKKKSLNEDIIRFNDDLSVGPINNFNSKQRVDWWESVLVDNEYILAKESAELMDDTKRLEAVKNLQMPIVIWMAEIANDELGFLRLCAFLGDFNQPVFLIQMPGKVSGNSERPLSFGELGSGGMEDLYNDRREITKLEIIEFAKIWTELLNDKSLLRLRKEKFKYESAPEKYFDDRILELCGKDYCAAAKIMATIYAEATFKVNEDYVAWRMRKLIKERKLEYLGELGMIRDFQVKVLE